MGIVHAWPFSWSDLHQLCIISAIPSRSGRLQVAYRNKEYIATHTSVSAISFFSYANTASPPRSMLDAQPPWMHSLEICSKWSVQTNKNTHVGAQCSRTGVGLTQACPNKQEMLIICWSLLVLFVILSRRLMPPHVICVGGACIAHV